MSLEAFLDDFERRNWQRVSDGTVRIAVIGLGWWTVDQAIPAIGASELCETTVTVSSTSEKAKRVAAGVETATHGLSYDEFHAGEAADAYDAVYICSPNALHLPYARTAAELGKAVLCEKPIEASSERGQQMVDACDEAGVPLIVGYRMHTEPAIRRARKLIRDGVIGDPVHAIGTNSQAMLELISDPNQWRLDPELAGPGATVTDIGIYPLNTCRFLLDSDPVAAQAFMQSSHDAFDQVPDEHSSFMVEFDDGTYLAATASQNAQATTSLRIVGTNGEILVEPAFHMETEIRVTRDDVSVTLDTPQVNQMTELFDYAADRILTDAPIGPDGEHGVLDMRLIEAVYEAGESGRVVTLD